MTVVGVAEVVAPVVVAAAEVVAVVVVVAAGVDTRPLLEGSAQPGVTVELFARNAAGATVSLGTTVADGVGRFSFTPPTPLAEGRYDFTAQSTNAAGTKSAISAPYALVIDTTPPSAPVITSATDDVGSKQGPIANNGPTDDTTPTIVGTGNPGETIRVFDGGTLLGTTVVEAGGTWRFTPTTTLLEGPHTFTARAVDAAATSRSTPTPTAW